MERLNAASGSKIAASWRMLDEFSPPELPILRRNDVVSCVQESIGDGRFRPLASGVFQLIHHRKRCNLG
jgi:hypothetical protein